MVAVLLCVALEGAKAGKRKSKSKDKKKKADVDALKCGVCVALVELVQEEVRKKENDTTTLDLRWGLTAEVKEGRAKRLGKVIPYKRYPCLPEMSHRMYTLNVECPIYVHIMYSVFFLEVFCWGRSVSDCDRTPSVGAAMT